MNRKFRALIFIFLISLTLADLFAAVKYDYLNDKIERSGRTYTYYTHTYDSKGNDLNGGKQVPLDEAAYTFSDEKAYMVPIGSSGINLMSKAYPSRDGIENPSDLKYFEGALPSTPNEKRYYDQNIIMTGGYADGLNIGGTSKILGFKDGNSNIVDYVEGATQINGAYLRSYILRRVLVDGAYLEISVSTDTGTLEMVSANNSAYRRPFELYIVGKYGGSERAATSPVSTLTKLSSANQTIKIPPYGQGSQTSFTPAGNSYLETVRNGSVDFPGQHYQFYQGSAFYFDIILALPGDFIPGTTNLDYKGRTYTLAEASDYTAMVTVTMNLVSSDGVLLATKSSTVPFTGYISLDEAYSESSYVSLSATPEPSASIIDIKTRQGDPFLIGSFDMMANLGQTTKPVADIENIIIFLSSSRVPQTAGSLFLFEKQTNSANNVAPNSLNSLGFTLEIEEHPGGLGQHATFYGDEYIESTGDSTGEVKRLAASSGEYVQAERYTINVPHVGNKNMLYYNFSGDIYMRLDTPPEAFEAGRYVENIYIHVISDLLPGTSTT